MLWYLTRKETPGLQDLLVESLTNLEDDFPVRCDSDQKVVLEKAKRKRRHRKPRLLTNEKVAKEAAQFVGKPVVGSGECYDLAVAIANAAGAKTASDFAKITGSRDQDYQWGKLITPDKIKPGDTLQFRNHKMVIATTITVTKGGKVIEKSPSPSIQEYVRAPQHTATVLSVNADGSFMVAEQHVLNRITGTESLTIKGDNRVYTRNTTLPPEIKTRTEHDVQIVTTTETKITVSGKIFPYRPQEDPKHKKDLDLQ
jgi:hypothetical protein